MEDKKMSNTVKVTDENFDEFVRTHPLVLVDAWAEWCMPCRILGPTIDALAKELDGKVIFGKLNVDENPATARRYGIMSIPTMLIFKNGKLVDSIVGALPKDYIKARLDSV